MKILFVIFVFLAFTLFKIVYANEVTEGPTISFPTLQTPNVVFLNITGGCGGFVDCTEYVGAVLYNIGAGIIFVVLFVIDLLVYIFELLAMLTSVAFTGIDGAPFWFNAITVTLFLAGIAFIIYKLIRKGSSEA